MGLLPAHEAVYLTAYTDADGAALDGAGLAGRYELRFPPGTLPPHADLGFWSLTMYDEKALLVPNEIDRYVVRPDTPGLTADADGGLTLRLQRGAPGDDVPAGNWLPAPDGAFSVTLRVYLPDPAVLDRRWVPPAIRRLA